MRRPLPSEILTFDTWTSRGEAEATRAGGSRARAFGPLPGETARCLVGGRKKGAREAWLQEILVPAPGRVEPRCPHFGLCGGCALQHLDPDTQVARKAEPVLAMLREAGGDFEALPTRSAPSPWFYRGKVELSFVADARDLGKGTSLGFNRRGRFDRVVDVRECFIGPRGNREILATVRAWMERHGLPGWDPRAHRGLLRYLVLRRSHATGQWLAALVTAEPPATWPVEELADALEALGATGVIHAVHNSPAGAVQVERSEVLRGQDRIVERLGPLEFDLSWRSFFQSNPPAFAGMLEEARRWVAPGPGQRVLDLFCGVGTVGLSLGGDLVGVETVPEAIGDARRNAARAGVQAEFHVGNSEDWPDLACDLLVLDPPRSGCHPKLVRRLPAEGPDRILYISCNPARLADELGVLNEAYRLRRVRLYDFFPQTPHVEALCLLERREAKGSPGTRRNGAP